jgi:hypothetical protein
VAGLRGKKLEDLIGQTGAEIFRKSRAASMASEQTEAGAGDAGPSPSGARRSGRRRKSVEPEARELADTVEEAADAAPTAPPAGGREDAEQASPPSGDAAPSPPASTE